MQPCFSEVCKLRFKTLQKTQSNSDCKLHESIGQKGSGRIGDHRGLARKYHPISKRKQN